MQTNTVFQSDVWRFGKMTRTQIDCDPDRAESFGKKMTRVKSPKIVTGVSHSLESHYH